MCAVMTNSSVCSWGYPAVAPGSLGPYRSPLDDAYRYYALQNLLDAGTGARELSSFC